ncbi:MAG: hypothetical protein B6244_12575 [Candidatus Cloacimonetes bacterium 4572_55]|nr:MAG: hypothetical protein B6244_12575 [Candidatus Cloacimonetes bacterium 4572_55]
MIRNRIIFTCIIGLLIAFTRFGAFAADTGSIQGEAVDAVSRDGLSGAHVTLDHTPYGAVVGNDGTYRIDGVPEGAYKITISRIGYHTESKQVTVIGKKMVAIDFYLVRSVIQSEGIVVTARGRTTRLKDVPGSIGVVRGRHIREEVPMSLADAAAQVPGISKASDMPWGSRINIRGLSKEQVVFLIDGNRVSTATEVAAQFGLVATQDIDRMEILKGPISVLYGTGSIGGVVNAITRKGKFLSESDWDIAFESSYESTAKGVGAYGRIGLNRSNFYFLATQSYRDYDNYKAGDGVEISNSQFEDRQTSISLGYRLRSQHKIEAKYQLLKAIDVGIPGAGGVFKDQDQVRYPETRREMFELGWTFFPSFEVWEKSEVHFFHQPIERRAEINRGEAKKIMPQADHDGTGARWQNQLATESHRFVVGAEWWQKELTGERIKQIQGNTIVDKALPDALYRPIGIFAEDEFQLSDPIALNFGARIDWIHTENDVMYKTYTPPSDVIIWDEREDHDTSWSLQTGLLYRVFPEIEVNFLIARAFRSPSLEERYNYIDLGSLVKLGDPELDPEESWFFETGVRFENEKFHATAQAFLNNTRNLVIEKQVMFEDREALQKTNAGAARLYGGELEAAYRLTPYIMVSSDMSYIRGRDTEKDENLPSISPLTGSFRMRYGIDKGFWTEASLSITADQNDVALDEATTDGSQIIEIRAGYKGFALTNIRHSLTLGVKNLTDSQYKNHLTRSRGFELYEPGRSFYLAWSMEM